MVQKLLGFLRGKKKKNGGKGCFFFLKRILLWNISKKYSLKAKWGKKAFCFFFPVLKEQTLSCLFILFKYFKKKLKFLKNVFQDVWRFFCF